ncbi:MAG: trimeric intracellular cation channel family protein [Sphingobium sp.]|jgi:uncharacterized membrane protein YeiH|nr:trimeric intracellular cation channel family protein [Sphingobium sp.]MCI1272447.1 trimeric intracellular cation channel family protein [Sphingobium sp.]MCI1755930.1 trimeric intracellular cation channel family protein [Sphingobium sp.]MCI2052297.1 trimeric intracellular cation channel family protein [Sphingobium sp.]
MNEHIESLAIWLNLAGISVFAASGALAAARKRLDFIAAWFFALVTATGGGTLRDLLIDVPVFWLFDPTPVVLCTIVAILVWAVPLRWWPDRTLEWLDAAGLAAYSVYGASKALHFGVSPIPAVAAGVITACIGGVIRDITAGIPSVLVRNEIYVTASLLAAMLYVLLTTSGIAAPWSSTIGFVAGFSLRAAAIHWRMALPLHRGH